MARMDALASRSLKRSAMARSSVALNRHLLRLFSLADRANEPRPVPNVHTGVVGLLGEHLRGELAGVFIRRHDGIVPLLRQDCSAAEVQSITHGGGSL